MAVRTLEELLTALEPLKEQYGDLQISLMEDLTDTLKALDQTALTSRISELEQMVKQVDEKWKERYRARFLTGEVKEEPEKPEESEESEKAEEKITINDVMEKWKEEI